MLIPELERGRRRNFCGGEFKNKARADGGVVFDAEEAVVLCDDSGRDSEAKARAAILGGEMRKEEFVLVGGRDAMAGVFDDDFYGIGFRVEARKDANVFRRRRFEGFGSVVDKIDDDAAEEAGVGADCGKRFRE